MLRLVHFFTGIRMWPVARRGLVYLPPLSKQTIFTRGQAQIYEEACASKINILCGINGLVSKARRYC